LWGEYPTDTAEILRYARAARSAEGFADYMTIAQMEPA
jgi:glutaconate CoA-transferase subunit A